VLWLVVTVLLDLEQRWAENVNLAFFKIQRVGGLRSASPWCW